MIEPLNRKKVAIVTGGSAGIGAAIARRLAHRGFSVVAVARRGDRLEKDAIELRELGLDYSPQRIDITREEERVQLVSEVVARFGRIDVLVNNAGVGYRSPIETTPLEEIRRNFEVNVFSLLRMTQLVIPAMKAQRHGRIVNVSSVAGRVARPLSSIYDATKHSIEALSDGLRGELRVFGIDVVVIQPGFTHTEFLDVSEQLSSLYYDGQPEYRRLRSMLDSMDIARRRNASSPTAVARVVERAVTEPKPKRRYVCSSSAKLTLALKRLLPESVFERLSTPAWQQANTLT